MVNPIFLHLLPRWATGKEETDDVNAHKHICQARAVRDDVGALLTFKGVESLDRCLTKMTEK